MRDRTACLQYLLHKKTLKPSGRVMQLLEFEKMGWDTQQNQIYGMDFVKQEGDAITLRTEYIPNPTEFMSRKQDDYPPSSESLDRPIWVPNWVKDERPFHFSDGGIVPVPNLYSHYSGGIRSKKQFFPPFRIQTITDVPYSFGLLPSTWCYCCTPVTNEFDFFETNESDIWFAHNFATGPNWEPATRDISASHLGCAIKGLHTIDFELTATTAQWFLDGKLIKTRKGAFNYPYYILATLIVTHPLASEIEWTIQQLSIQQ